MIEAYAIKVAAALEDGITPSLLRIIDKLTVANAAMIDFAMNARKISRLGLSIGKNLDKAAAGASALGDSASGLARADAVLNSMAASSAELVRNLRAANTAGGGMGQGPGAGEPSSSSRSSGGSSNSGSNTAAAAGITAAYGLYENARLQDTNIMAAATSQISMPLWVKTADELREREFAYARQYAFATHGSIAPFGQAMLESSRLLRTLSPNDQRILTDAAMPYAAVEAKLKDIPLPEAMQAFIGLAHQAGAYTPAAANPLFESMMQASLTTHAGLDQIARAASYALPSLHAAGANSSDVMLLLATMMQAGILNTKSGTWLNNMAMNALPNTLGSGLFKNKLQNQALETLGLYKNGRARFYKNGELDLMTEVSLLAEARQRMSPLEFNAATRQAFGVQGQRAASLFSERQVLQNLSTLGALSRQAQAPIDIAEAIRTLSTVAQADQTIANANMTLMNATSTFMGPASKALDTTSGFFGWTADFTKKHPIIGGAMDLGLGIGAAAILGKTWKGTKLAVDIVGSKVFSPLAKGITGMATTILTNPYVVAMLGAGAAGYGVGMAINSVLPANAKDKIGSMVAHVMASFGDKDAQHAISINEMRPPQYKPIQVHTQVNLDGRQVAQVVTHHQSKQANLPYNRAPGFDQTRTFAPVSN